MLYCNYKDILDKIDRQSLLALVDEESEHSPDIFDLFIAGIFSTDHAQIKTIIEDAVDSAESVVDSYCCGIYTLPFDPVPKIIKLITVDITIYELFSRGQQEVPEIRKNRYNNSIKLLEKFLKGEISLNIGTLETGLANDQTVYISSNSSSFTEKNMVGF